MGRFPIALLDTGPPPSWGGPGAEVSHLLASTDVCSNAFGLPVVLGRRPDGTPAVEDLARLPPLLLAGAPGSGKSTALRAIIASLVYRRAPQHLVFILIDTDGDGLCSYANLPHLLTPRVVDRAEAINALQWTMWVMDRRYAELGAQGVRTIQAFNDSLDPSASLRRMPHIVVIIDELAGLMRRSPEVTGNALCELAQLSRAVGIHLIISTGDTSVDVLTGLLKANLPARVAFKARSAVASRDVLDAFGAEVLVEPGGALYLGPAARQPERIHTPWVSPEAALRVVEHLQQHDTCCPKSSTIADAQPARPKPPHDDLYDAACRYVVATGDKSITGLQNHLRVGFSRAARLRDRMEDVGLV